MLRIFKEGNSYTFAKYYSDRFGIDNWHFLFLILAHNLCLLKFSKVF